MGIPLRNVGESVRMGLSAIRAYKLRAGLTVLGVVMGIMTVTGMSSVVAGLNATIAGQIEGLGSSVIFIRPQAPGERLDPDRARRRRGLNQREVEAIARRCPAVANIAAIEPLFGNRVQSEGEEVQGVQLLGMTPAYEDVHAIYARQGRFLGESDVRRGAAVAVLGSDIADSLFPWTDPVGKELTIDGRRFTVIGVLERQGKFLFINRDNIIAVPLGVVQKKDPRFNFVVADLRPVSAELLPTAVDQVQEALRRERRLRFFEPDDFAVFTQQALTDLYTQVTGGIYMVMIAISSIGLVVGGVGVMNIMLVSVTERTREIGLRKAMGARRRDILWQFLTEAMTLTAVGGVLGVVAGALAAFVVNALSPFPATLQPLWIMVALVTSMAVGLVFGLWPAAKASRLDPIEALRYE